jgi:hypothetical protein
MSIAHHSQEELTTRGSRVEAMSAIVLLVRALQAAQPPPRIAVITNATESLGPCEEDEVADGQRRKGSSQIVENE